MAKLFKPISFRDMDLKNRIVMPPMCQYSADNDGYVNDWHYLHYGTRAVGGVGLIIIEATAIEPRGRISDRDLGIWSDNHIDGLKRLVDICKANGAKIGIQLAHAGRKCGVSSEKIVAPSPIRFSDEYKVPIELSKDEIKNIVAAFASAAERAYKAGFDIVEIHGAHGYLINEFLSPLSNHRTDEYGGSKENRARLLQEVIEAVRKVWPKNKPLMVRVSAEDYDVNGNHPEDISDYLNMMNRDDIDIIHVSSGAVVSNYIHTYPGYQVTFSEKIKNLTGLPTIAGGLITSPLMAEEILENNRGDLVFLGRELLRNPYWPLEAAKVLKEDLKWPTQYERAK
jgi:NADPH2 dehydrogenase